MGASGWLWPFSEVPERPLSSGARQASNCEPASGDGSATALAASPRAQSLVRRVWAIAAGSYAASSYTGYIFTIHSVLACAAACTRCVVAAGDSPGEKWSTRRSFEGDLSTHYLSLCDAHYLVAKLVAQGDALCRPLLPELYEPVLTNPRERRAGASGVRARSRGRHGSGVAVRSRLNCCRHPGSRETRSSFRTLRA